MRLQEQIAEAKAHLKDLRRQQDGVRSRRKILCSCGRRHAIKDLSLIVTHWYVQPHGCTGGDYWLEGEWQFHCPDTGMRNRLLFHDTHLEYEDRRTVGKAAEATFKTLYRNLFKERSDEYEDRPTTYAFHNNFDVEKNRAKFELPVKSKDHPSE